MATRSLLSGTRLGLVIFLDIQTRRRIDNQFKGKYVISVAFNQLALLPCIIVGIVILSNGLAGLYWIVPAIIFSFLKAVLDAWVLLVEIHR